MSETPVQVKSVQLGSSTFNFVVKQGARGDNKGKPFLAVDFGKVPDANKMLAFIGAAGQTPILVNVQRWINREIGPATFDAFVAGPDGKPVFDAAIAANAILSAIADSVSEGNDQLKEELEAVRAEQSKAYDAVLQLLQSKQPVSQNDLNRLANLKVKVTQIEAKLAKKTRKPKDAAAEAPKA